MTPADARTRGEAGVTSAAEHEAHARLMRILHRVLPRVGYEARPGTVERLAVELRREGCQIRYPDPAPPAPMERASW